MDEAIDKLREESLAASDFVQARLCEIALGDVISSFTARNQARDHCLKAIAEAKAMEDK